MSKKNKIIIGVLLLFLVVSVMAYQSSPSVREWVCKKTINKNCLKSIGPHDPPGSMDGMTLEERKKRKREIHERAQRLKKLGLEEYSEEKE